MYHRVFSFWMLFKAGNPHSSGRNSSKVGNTAVAPGWQGPPSATITTLTDLHNSQFISGNDQLITCIPARSPASTPAMLSSMTRQFSGEAGGGSNLCQDIKERVVMQVEPAGCHCEYVGVRLPARHLWVIAAIHLHEELAFFLFLKMEPPCG